MSEGVHVRKGAPRAVRVRVEDHRVGVAGTHTGIGEAPMDGRAYERMNGTWVPDDKDYLRLKNKPSVNGRELIGDRQLPERAMGVAEVFLIVNKVFG